VPAKPAPQKVDIYDIANRLWEAADELRANSHLKAAEYSIPVLGMFVQSARFVDEHRNGKSGRLSIYGQERVDETVRERSR
jgi:hypothetical protein